jgi:hypothetical protein|tara:strand:- start:347 stop:559 length:213 start_codon:yes stop_codon:yes gene_type:complete
MIDQNDPIWKTFVEYKDLLSSQGKDIGIDVYGTDQLTAMALSLTQTYYINELRKEVDKVFAPDNEISGNC